MIDNKFTFKDYQELLIARNALQKMRHQNIIDQNYQNALRSETRLKEKLDKKGVSPELQKIIDAAIVVQKAQQAMLAKLQEYNKKYDGKPEFEKGGIMLDSEKPKTMKNEQE